MTPEKRKTAIEWLQNEVRSLRIAPKINGCGPENWADLLEVMETCLEAVRGPRDEPLTLEQLREMGGRPAWCEEQKEWGIIHIDPDGMWANIPFFRGVRCYLDVQRQGLTLYSYPPAHIDRKAWEPCKSCKSCGSCKNREGYNPYEGTLGECGTCYKDSNYDPDNFCHECGRPLTEEAWAELENRLMGVMG